MKKWFDWLIAIDFWIYFPLFVFCLMVSLVSFLSESEAFGESMGMMFLGIIALIPIIGIGLVLYTFYKKPKD